MTDTENQLLKLLKERCYQEGDFTLSSGEKSKFYFDVKSVFMSSVGTHLIGKAIYDVTRDLPIQAIGGLEIGAIPLTTAAVQVYHQNGKVMEGFFVRGEAKKHGTRKIIEGRLQPGSQVAIVDDVATKGGSVMKAVEAVRLAECKPLVIVVLVDRQEGAAQLFAREGIAFRPLFTMDQVKNAR
jgi:orotate phosphoribosyltransferase